MRTKAIRLALAVVLLTAGASWAAEDPSLGVVIVELRDGGRLVGRVLEETPGHVRLRTGTGLELDIPRNSIASIRRAGEAAAEEPRLDPNYSRLMFAPTGRPLKKGDGYFSDYELLFPGVAYGLTDQISLAGGVSTVPGIGLDEQLFYVSPRIGHSFSDRVAASAGLLYARGGGGSDGESGLILFGVATLGGRDRSLTLGYGFATETGSGAEGTSILVVGGTATLSRRVALVSENWLVLNDDFRLSEQPFGVAVRFFSDRLSADVGLILIGEAIEEGFPVPWVSVSYHFGPSRGRDLRRPAASTGPMGRPALASGRR
jgi:hypothetical protein